MPTPAQALLMRKAAAAGGFTPASITGLQAWYDPSDTATVTHSGGTMSQINDKSGNGRNATQGTAGDRPAYGSRTKNGLNVIDSVSDDRLVTASFTLAQPFTIAFVGVSDAAANAGFVGNNVGTASVRFQKRIATNDYFMFAGSGIQGGVSDTNWHVFVCIYNGASSAVWVDGVSAISGNPGANGTTTGFTVPRVNGSAAIDGAIGEWCIYNSALGTSDRDALESYLGTKWGITVT